VLRAFEKELLGGNMELALRLLNNLPEDLTEDVLFDNIAAVRVSEKAVNAALEEIHGAQ
jgi:hypothetical protein